MFTLWSSRSTPAATKTRSQQTKQHQHQHQHQQQLLLQQQQQQQQEMLDPEHDTDDQQPPETPAWAMDDFVQFDSPPVTTVTPSQLLATQHHSQSPQSKPTQFIFPSPADASSQQSFHWLSNEPWGWDLSLDPPTESAPSPRTNSIFMSSGYTSSNPSTARSSASLPQNFSLSPLVRQFGDLPTVPQPHNMQTITPSTSPSYNPSHRNSIADIWPQQYGSLPKDGLATTAPIAIANPASPVLSYNNNNYNIYKPAPTSPARFNRQIEPANAHVTPAHSFDNSSADLMTFSMDEFNMFTNQMGDVSGAAAGIMATMSLPTTSQLAAHMGHTQSTSPVMLEGWQQPSPNQTMTIDTKTLRARRREQSLPPSLDRNRTITRASNPIPVPISQQPPSHSVRHNTLFGSPQGPGLFGSADSSTSPTPLLFINQTAQYTPSTSTARPSPTSPNKFSYEELGYSSTSPRKEAKKRKRIEDEEYNVEDADSEDRRMSDDTPAKSELRPPKQAPSMWQLFFADWLQEHKTKYPNDKLNVAQAAKEAGVLYKNLSEEEKLKLQSRVQREKDDRERKLQAWQRTLTPEDIKRENKFRTAQRKMGLSRKANIKDPNAPKKPLSAYFMFLAAIRSDPVLVHEVFGDEMETTRQSVLAAKRWREMTDEEKRPFLTKAEHDKLQYEAARKVYEEGALGTTSNSFNTGGFSTITFDGTGYILPQETQTYMPDATAAIFASRISNRDPSAPYHRDESRERSTSPPKPSNRSSQKSKLVPRKKTLRRTQTNNSYSGGGNTTSSTSASGAGESDSNSPDSDEEWVPGNY